jgi:hypothetical protein
MENQGIYHQMVIIPQPVWESVQNDIQQVKELLQSKTTEEINNQWVESTEARKMLKVSSKTWQTYRDKRIIPFSQVGRKIYVRRSDLQKFMEKHYIINK